MNRLFLAFFVFSGVLSLGSWQPSPGHSQLPIWPGSVPDAHPVPGSEYATTIKNKPVAGRPWVEVDNVSRPTMTVYSPEGKNTGTAVVVFPGGGYVRLAIDLEGTEVCDWLTSAGITCVLLKYRVPSVPYDWHCDCRPNGLAISTLALEDAQRTVGLVRFHANEWHIDPHKIGVLGFSAGGYLVAEISTHFDHRLYAPVDAPDRESCRRVFASEHLNNHTPVHVIQALLGHASPDTVMIYAKLYPGQLIEEYRKTVRSLYNAYYGEDGLKNPTTEEWAAFAANCNLRDMGTHLCALPTGEHCPKGLICLGCAHA